MTVFADWIGGTDLPTFPCVLLDIVVVNLVLVGRCDVWCGFWYLQGVRDPGPPVVLLRKVVEVDHGIIGHVAVL